MDDIIHAHVSLLRGLRVVTSEHNREGVELLRFCRQWLGPKISQCLVDVICGSSLSAVVVQREVSSAEHDVVLEGVSGRRGIAVEEVSAVVVGARGVDLVVVDVGVDVAFPLVFFVVHITCCSTGT